VDDLRATKSEDVGLIVRAVSFQDFQPMWSWSINVTDRQTDDMWSHDCTLHCSASRGKKIAKSQCKQQHTSLKTQQWTFSTLDWTRRFSALDIFVPF